MHHQQTTRDELTRAGALLEITLVIVNEITPKITLDECQKEEGERKKQFHHGRGRGLFVLQATETSLTKCNEANL
jgi:hypothetical protein